MDRQTFMAAATRLHEFEVDSMALDLGKVWIRELTARQRVDALEGAYLRGDDGAVLTTDQGFSRYDDALYRAFVLQAGLISGPGGDLVLTLEDVAELAARGRKCLDSLSDEVLNLSWLTRRDLFRRSPQADDRQRATEAGDTPPGDGAEREGTPDADLGSPVADGPGGDQGNAA